MVVVEDPLNDIHRDYDEGLDLHYDQFYLTMGCHGQGPNSIIEKLKGTILKESSHVSQSVGHITSFLSPLNESPGRRTGSL